MRFSIGKIGFALAFAGLFAGFGGGLAFAQNRSTFGAQRNAFDYAYGVNPNLGPLTVAPGGGTTATGSGTLTLNFGFVTAADGTVFNPLNVNAPITVGEGASQETVTPSGVSCNTPQISATCQVTATFTYMHGTGDVVSTGSVGLQEALNLQAGAGGGVVIVTPPWQQYGGTNTIITSAAVYSSVYIYDTRGSTGYGAGKNTFWTVQPTTLTDLATPTTLTASNVVFTSATGTWAASATYFCVTYVDVLGGESPCSATYNQTPTVNYTLTVTSPAASTGAVGWRMYAGTTSVALAYLLPITSSACTLSTLESVMPACAIGSGGVWPATFVTTTALSPVALGVTNTNNPVPQGHTTFAYEPSAVPPVSFQTQYGPFGTGTIASATASDVTPLGSFELPAGYLNQIGRVVRVTGKIALTAGASSTLGIYVGMNWPGGVTAGLPITVCNPISGFVFATAASVVEFTCTMTTNAVGATAVGTIMPESWFIGNTAAGTGTTSPTGVEKSAGGIIGTLGLFAQDQFTVYITPLVAADTVVQLNSLHIETLQ